jgi:hypothetical protein
MKQCEYIEGRDATENFEEGMKALFKVPKRKAAEVAKKPSRPSQTKQPKRADED